jgi:hypothetical protein
LHRRYCDYCLKASALFQKPCVLVTNFVALSCVLQYSNNLTPLEPGAVVQLLCFRTVPGNSKHITNLAPGIMPTSGYDSHSSANHMEWYVRALV